MTPNLLSNVHICDHPVDIMVVLSLCGFGRILVDVVDCSVRVSVDCLPVGLSTSR